MSYCPNCGVQILPNAKYCVNCGTALTITQSQQNTPVVTQNPQPTPEPQIQNRQQTINPPVQNVQPNVNPNAVKAVSKKTVLPLGNPTLWGAVMVIIGFFSNWFKGFGTTNALRMVMENYTAIDSGQNNVQVLVLKIALALLIISAMLCLLASFSFKLGGLFGLVKSLPIICMIVFIGIMVSSMGGSFDFDALVKVFAIGFYLCLVGAVVLTFGKQ